MVLELYALQEHPQNTFHKSSAALYGSFSLPLGLKPSMTGRFLIARCTATGRY
jgi:hypothetical protein